MFINIGVLKHFAIFTRKQLCWSYFLIKLKDCRPAILLKRDSNTDVFLECYEIFKKHVFWTTASELLIVKLTLSLGICQPYLPNHKHFVEWFLLRRLKDLLRVYSLLIVSRNYSYTFLIDLQKTKTYLK